MKCPHCLENFHEGQTWWSVFLGNDDDGAWLITRRHCPTCRRFVFELEKGAISATVRQGTEQARLGDVVQRVRAWPSGVSRAPIPSEVPARIAEDYREACLVLAESPKASAALGRRCLQNLLREAAGVKRGDLSDEIQQIIDAKTLPSTIADNIDAVRAIGNFAAHPVKSKGTGEIVDVEPAEAEWTLDVLESLFDFYYVMPARAKAKREALNKKMQAAGKPPVR